MMDALLLMPFGKSFNDVHNSIVRACEAHASHLPDSYRIHEPARQLNCVRIDDHGRRPRTFNIVQALVEAIRGAAFCIADITDNNKNVLWELGFAMALDKPVIIITQDRTSVGFDLQGMRNLEYSRTSIDDTLLSPLAKEIAEVVQQLPDPAKFPRYAAHAKALAMSTASPSYFLGSDYAIKYMNEAASALFDAGPGRGGAYWINKTLREFMNSFAHRLKNLAVIEWNLQVQTEKIRELESAGKVSAICPYNIETIVLDSPDYGVLELQKTAVAVKGPSSGEIIGWVVSFNVMNAHEPERFAKFHQKHKNLIEGTLRWNDDSPHTGLSPHVPILEPAGEGVLKWLAAGCPSPRFSRAEGYAQKQKAFEFAAAMMRTPKYGLTSVEHLPLWFFDYENAEFIQMFSPSDDLVAVFRIYPNHNLEQYEGLSEDVLEAIRDKQPFADVGAYLIPELRGDDRKKCLAQLLGHATYFSEATLKQVHLYAQVPAHALEIYERFMFLQAGNQFSCKGWTNKWVPVYLKCAVYRGELNTNEVVGMRMSEKLRDDDLEDRQFIEWAAAAHQAAKKAAEEL